MLFSPENRRDLEPAAFCPSQARLWLCLLGAIIGALGACYLLAWHTALGPALGLLLPYESALGFLLIGAALFLYGRGRNRGALFFASFVAALALANFLEIAFAVPLGVARFPERLGIGAGAVRYQRMLLNSAICFFLAGSSIAILATSRWRNGRTVIVSLAGALAFVLSLTAFLGYLFHLSPPGAPIPYLFEPSYLIGDFGHLFLTFSLLLLVRQELMRYAEYAPFWIALPVGISGVAATLLVWEGLRSQFVLDADTSYSARALANLVLIGGTLMSCLLGGGVALAQFCRRRAREVGEGYELLRALIESTSDSVFVKDRDGRYLIMNSAGARALALEPDDAIGKDVWQLFPPAEAEEVFRADQRVITEGKPLTYERERVRRGVRRSFLTTKAPYRDATGKIVGIVGISRDITERVQSETRLRESEEKFRRIFDEAPIGLFLTEPSTRRVLQVNEAFLQFTGFSREDVVGKRAPDLTHPDDREAALQQVDRLVRGELASLRLEKRYASPRGGVVWAEVSLIILRDAQGQALYLLSMAVDITARKQSDEAIRALNDSLEIRVEDRTRSLALHAKELAESRTALQTLAGNLSRSNEELQQFAYIASHDLQEPLRMIASYLTLLSRRYQRSLDKEAQDFIGFAVDGALRLKLLLDDLLKFSRVQTRRQEQALVDTRALAQTVITGLGREVEESGAQVILEPLPAVIADSAQLAQLFQNLLGNALKFRGAAHPSIRINAREQGDQWLFQIQDNGIGFDMRHAERIFVIFQRLHSKGEYSGTGVGLAICKKIVERLGGKIWAVSAPGHGATFSFTLPRLPGSVTSEGVMERPARMRERPGEELERTI